MESSAENSTEGNLRRTPLYDFHRRHGARFVDFGGWDMPVQYGSILDEHRTVRTAAGLFDVSHMGEIRVTGQQAAAFLDHLVTNKISDQPSGKAIYSPMCYPHGGTVDDLLVYKRSDEEFLLCVNASNVEKDLAWMRTHSAGFTCSVEDRSASYALLALQGPAAAEILQPLANLPLAGVGYYYFAEGEVGGAPAIISRTGYTGEDGFEIFLAPEAAERVAEAILLQGRAKDLQLAGLGARDSLRLEAGFALYGHELSDEISPIQAGLSWTVRFDKTGDFIGRAPLEIQKKQGADPRVAYFRTGSRRIVRPGAPILSTEGEAGVVLSGTLSPHLNEAVGTALLKRNSFTTPLHADIRGQQQPIEIVKPPFYRRSPTT